MRSNLFAGAGLGLIVGMLVGLSTSPVVSIVVSALATGVITLLGFTRVVREGESPSVDGSTARLGAFGFACAAAIILGVCVRTHNWLSPSIRDQVQAIRDAGYSPEQARQWVSYKIVGAPFTDAPATGRATVLRDGESVLFAAKGSGNCQFFKRDAFKDAKGQLTYMLNQQGKYKELAQTLSQLDANNREAVLTSLEPFFCAE